MKLYIIIMKTVPPLVRTPDFPAFMGVTKNRPLPFLRQAPRRQGFHRQYAGSRQPLSGSF